MHNWSIVQTDARISCLGSRQSTLCRKSRLHEYDRPMQWLRPVFKTLSTKTLHCSLVPRALHTWLRKQGCALHGIWRDFKSKISPLTPCSFPIEEASRHNRRGNEHFVAWSGKHSWRRPDWAIFRTSIVCCPNEKPPTSLLSSVVNGALWVL